MNDTHPSVAVQFLNLMKKKSNTERLLMGFSMFDTAKQIVRDAILNEKPEITPGNMKAEFFLRFYGRELSEAEQEKILQSFKRNKGVSP